jgi:hypothetical protein
MGRGYSSRNLALVAETDGGANATHGVIERWGQRASGCSSAPRPSAQPAARSHALVSPNWCWCSRAALPRTHPPGPPQRDEAGGARRERGPEQQPRCTDHACKRSAGELGRPHSISTTISRGASMCMQSPSPGRRAGSSAHGGSPRGSDSLHDDEVEAPPGTAPPQPLGLALNLKRGRENQNWESWPCLRAWYLRHCAPERPVANWPFSP